MNDGSGLAEAMLGLDGVKVLDVEERPGEVVVPVEPSRRTAHCRSCRKRARPHDRTAVHLRDVHLCGRPLRLVVLKRRWRCQITEREFDAIPLRRHDGHGDWNETITAT